MRRKCKLRYLNNKKGFTLLELVISMAIIGLLTVGFLQMFTFGLSRIFSAGRYSKAQYLAQQAFENKLAGLSISLPQYITSPSDSNLTVTLNFQHSGQADVNIAVNGKLKKIIFDNGKNRVDLSTFLSD